MATSLGSKLTEENTKVPFDGALMVKRPSAFVDVPAVPPLTRTETPLNAESPEDTRPLTVTEFCADAEKKLKKLRRQITVLKDRCRNEAKQRAVVLTDSKPFILQLRFLR